MFRKILVANRGEIAVRVLRTCKKMGIATVTVYSEADAGGLFVRMADEAVEIGPPPALQSYLAVDRILAAAKRTGAEAIHPGYGFLAENGDFVQACEAAGIVFIGPTAEAMRLLGDKQSARQAMARAGLPVIPGNLEPIGSEAEAAAVADQIGYPVMVKASFGGGGIGMTLVQDRAHLARALKKAANLAERAFGRGEIYLEKVIPEPHHIEFQVLADHHGNVATIFERECSVQRRHQKVIEESPSPFITPEVRADMATRIAAAARAIGYRNAGTFECLMDAERHWYFLEVNKRLQVEHPVTELVTGLDLVAEQIRIAAGEPLSEAVRNARSVGHAIEARLYAEDPAQKFLPQPGRIEHLVWAEGEGIRVDTGVESGTEISHFYDPLFAKVIAWGKDRAEAAERLASALERTVIDGLVTNRDFLARVLRHPVFLSGIYTTHFIEDHLAELIGPPAEESSPVHELGGGTVLAAREGSIGWLTIHRPEARNALNADVLEGLAAGLAQHEADPGVRVIVLTGAGERAFCAGADLRMDPSAGLLAMHEGRGRYAELLLRFQHCGKPTVARVNGHALGGGLGLALACDIVVAAEGAEFGTPEIRLGLFPMTIMALLVRHVPRKKLLEMMLTGTRVPAAQAVQLGMASHVVPAAELDHKVAEVAQALASKSAAVLRLGKRAFYTMEDMALEQALAYLQGMLTVNSLTEDAMEGVLAFVEKREPRWKDR